MSRKKGFTLVELLVVIGIIALLVSILMPALGRARELAKRIQCAANLNGIGKAIAIYQNEYRDQNPRPWRSNLNQHGFGGAGSGPLYNDPDNPSKPRWSLQDWDDWDNFSTVGGCLYLLVKYMDVDPKMFICPSAPDDEPMMLEDAIATSADVEGWEDCVDFRSGQNLSYSYNDPWNRLLDSSASASLVLMADKSNAYDTPDFSVNPQAVATANAPNVGEYGNLPNGAGVSWDDEPVGVETTPNAAHGNSRNHGTDIQEVLYADTHVTKADTPLVGLGEDNIYTFQSAQAQANEFAPWALGRWGFEGNGEDLMYDSDLNGPSDKDSYLGN